MYWQTLVPAYDGSHTTTIVMIGKCLRGQSAWRREKTFNLVVTFSRYTGRHGIAKGRKAYPHAFLPERR
jgi:hypothetical protein